MRAKQVDVFPPPPPPPSESCPEEDMKMRCGENELTTGINKEYLVRRGSLFHQHSSLPLTEEQIKQALQQSIMRPKFSSFFCIPSFLFQRRKKKGFDVKNFSPKSVFHYELESLIETRVVKEVIEPYDFKPIDSSENGPIPDPWDAPVTAPGNFMEGEITYLIPHSEEVITCSPCEGDGNVFCSVCKGLGRRRFSVMYPNQSPTSTSKLSVLPEPPCYKCKTTGQVRCKDCDGVGSLKRSLLMTVTWKKLHDHVYSGEAAAKVPIKKLKKVKGVVVKSEWGQRVSPLTGPLPSTQYSIPEVAQASIDLQLKHATVINNSRIVEQRQTVEQIPVTVVNYGQDLRRKSSFFVYGMEREVFFPGSSSSSTSNTSSDSSSQTSESSIESETSDNFNPKSI